MADENPVTLDYPEKDPSPKPPPWRFNRPAYPTHRIFRGSVFCGVEVGCVCATILIIFTVLCAFSLLAIAWWPNFHR